MQILDTSTVLDREQLRDVTMDDPELMREIVSALIDDTSRNLEMLGAAIRAEDSPACVRLAHYSKGACANVGANAAAALLKHIETTAKVGDFGECSTSLATLAKEIDRLKEVAITL